MEFSKGECIIALEAMTSAGTLPLPTIELLSSRMEDLHIFANTLLLVKQARLEFHAESLNSQFVRVTDRTTELLKGNN